MNTTSPNLIFTTEGFANRAELTAHAEEKVAKLLRHAHPHVDLVRLHVKRETRHSRPASFMVRAIAETAGPDYLTHSESDEPATAINCAFDKLERSVTADARARKHLLRRAACSTLGLEFAGT